MKDDTGTLIYLVSVCYWLSVEVLFRVLTTDSSYKILLLAYKGTFQKDAGDREIEKTYAQRNLLQIGVEGKTFQHQSHQLGAAWINSHCEGRVKEKPFTKWGSNILTIYRHVKMKYNPFKFHLFTQWDKTKKSSEHAQVWLIFKIKTMTSLADKFTQKEQFPKTCRTQHIVGGSTGNRLIIWALTHSQFASQFWDYCCWF